MMQTIEDSFDFLEQLGMSRIGQKPRTFYCYHSDEREHGVAILGDIRRFYFVHMDYYIRQEISHYHKIAEQYLEIGVLYHGDGFYSVTEGSMKKETYQPGTLFYIHQTTGAKSWMFFAAGTHCCGNSLIIREAVWKEYLSHEVQKRYGPNADLLSIIKQLGNQLRPLCRRILNELAACSYQEQAAELFLEAKVNEFIAALLHTLGQTAVGPVIPLTEYDQNAARQAMAILQDQLKDPPPVKLLAKMVGLNINKMQAAFRELCGVTAGEYLRAYRMEKALELLNEDLLLEEIARRVGYKSASRFSEAFAKSYGALPSQYRKSAIDFTSPL